MILVKINNSEYDFFLRVELNLAFDKAGSEFNITCIVDLSNPDLRELYRPKSFSTVKLYIDTYDEDNLVFTGIALAHSKKVSENGTTLSISGYSTSGEAGLSIPKEAYPLQDDGKTLKQIAEKILTPLGVDIAINQSANSRMNEAYDEANAEPTDSCIGYLSRLARQKNIIIGNTANGKLLFTDYNSQGDVAGEYDEQSDMITELGSDVNAQNMHSHIRVLNQSNFDDGDKQEFVSTNPSITRYRPFVTVQTDGNINDGENLAKSAVNAEQRNEQYYITIPTHRYKNGEIARPNRVVKLKSQSLDLDSFTKLFVYDTTLISDKEGHRTSIKLIPLTAIL